jgi:ParB-like chromosome segregation protein Spo0J
MNEELKNLLITLSNKNNNFIHEIRLFLHNEISKSTQPIDNVLWVDINKVKPNDYNPNSVASVELKLLYTSIKHDGYTQPIVTIRDDENDCYVIVDGFHRYFTMKNNKDIFDLNNGLVPIVVIKSNINDRMASTVRHNRARGKHSVTGMSNMVFNMLENGWSDSHICNELGMEAEELIKLKHITGFSKLFANTEYKKSWETKKMIKLRNNLISTDELSPL